MRISDWSSDVCSSDLDNVLGGQRLEVEAVRGVVIRRHRLRIAVHHDGFIAGLAEGIGGVDAAVVELDALADAVRPAAEAHHLGAGAGIGLALRWQWPIGSLMSSEKRRVGKACGRTCRSR